MKQLIQILLLILTFFGLIMHVESQGITSSGNWGPLSPFLMQNPTLFPEGFTLSSASTNNDKSYFLTLILAYDQIIPIFHSPSQNQFTSWGVELSSSQQSLHIFNNHQDLYLCFARTVGYLTHRDQAINNQDCEFMATGSGSQLQLYNIGRGAYVTVQCCVQNASFLGLSPAAQTLNVGYAGGMQPSFEILNVQPDQNYINQLVNQAQPIALYSGCSYNDYTEPTTVQLECENSLSQSQSTTWTKQFSLSITNSITVSVSFIVGISWTHSQTVGYSSSTSYTTTETSENTMNFQEGTTIAPNSSAQLKCMMYVVQNASIPFTATIQMNQAGQLVNFTENGVWSGVLVTAASSSVQKCNSTQPNQFLQ